MAIDLEPISVEALWDVAVNVANNEKIRVKTVLIKRVFHPKIKRRNKFIKRCNTYFKTRV
jgi:hypothetical protein